MSSHEEFMRMAIALAESNVISGNGGPFGAVIVKEGAVVAQSANMVAPQNDPTAHAEISAIRLACQALNTFNLQGCIIYTSCEPCPMCLGAIYWARINAIYFANTKKDAAEIGFDDHLIYDELEKDMDARQKSFIQLLRDEALQAFRMWTESDGKISY
jgi:tRNA(Arg) A34 adenosine deaminase TadA